MTRAPIVATLLAASALVLAACGGTATTSGPPAWNHDPADAEFGPEGWGSLDETFEACLDGDEQSPIDIADPVTADLPPLVFDYPEAPLVVENTGHVIEVPIPEEAGHALAIGDEVYTLEQYHFHAPSEHTVDGVAYDVEAHFVHRNDEDELAVVGVLFDTDAPPSELLDAIMANAPAEAGEEVEVDEVRSPSELLPLGGAGVRDLELFDVRRLADHARLQRGRALDRADRHARRFPDVGRPPARADRRLPRLRRPPEQQPADPAAQRPPGREQRGLAVRPLGRYARHGVARHGVGSS